MQFGIILLVLVVAASVCGSLIVQQRTSMEYVTRYGEAAAAVILWLQLDNVFASPIFLIPMAGLCLNLTLCSLVRIKNTGRAAKRLIERAGAADATEAVAADDIHKVEACLKRQGCRLREKGQRRVYTKNLIGFYGSFITHLSFLLILVVGALAVLTAQVQDQTVMPGDTLTLQDGVSVTVHTFRIEDETGTLDYASEITMASADGTDTRSGLIRVNEPLSFEGYKVYQQTYGTAGAVSITNHANGASEVMHLTESCFLTLDGLNGLFFQALYPGYLKAEDGSVTLITSTSGAYSDPVYDVLSVAEGVMTPVLAFPGETLTIGDVSFTFEDPVSYPGLRIKYVSPIVLWALYAVFALMVAGLYLCFFTVPCAVTVTDQGYTLISPKPQPTLTMALENCLDEEDT